MKLCRICRKPLHALDKRREYHATCEKVLARARWRRYADKLLGARVDAQFEAAKAAIRLERLATQKT